MAGRILPETVIPDGGTASMAGNEMRVAEPEFAFRMQRICRRDRRPTRCERFSMRSARFIRRSRFRIRGLPISSAPERRKSSRTMPARICSCSVRRPRRTGARSISSRRSRLSRCAGKQFIGHGKNVLGDPRIGIDVARQRTAPARRDAESRRGGDNGHLPSAAANSVRRFVRGRFRLDRQGLGQVQVDCSTSFRAGA